MRAQYHFRDSDQGLLAWDIRRLLELSAQLPIEEVPLEQIQEFDENYWFSRQESEPTGRAIAEHIRLVEEADLTFPILLDSGGRLFDGMHRVIKAFLLGRKSIAATRFDRDPEPDYVGREPNELPY